MTMAEEMPDTIGDPFADPDDDVDRAELEIALYSQIHFESNPDIDTQDSLSEYQAHDDVNDLFHIDVKGNSKVGFKALCRTSDLILNEKLREYDINYEHIESGDAANTSKHSQKDSQTAVQHSSSSRKEDVENTEISLVDSAIVISDSSSADILGDSDMEDEWELLDEAISDDDNLHVNVHPEHRHLLKEKLVLDEDWGICDDDSFAPVKVRSRYYTTNTSFRCHNCREVGHAARNCPKEKVPTCMFCGTPGHRGWQCPDSICYNCNGPGHVAKECESPRRFPNAVCFRCNMQGHDKYKCPDTWRQYHTTVIEGAVTPGRKRKLSTPIFCYNCAADGHLGHECHKNRIDRHSKPTYPFICKYEKMSVQNKHVWFHDEDYESTPKKKKKATKIKKKLPFVYKDGSEPSGHNNFDKLMENESISETRTRKKIAQIDKKKKTKKNVNKNDKARSSHINMKTVGAAEPANVHKSLTKAKTKCQDGDSPITVTVSFASDSQPPQKEGGASKIITVKKTVTHELSSHNKHKPTSMKQSVPKGKHKVTDKESFSTNEHVGNSNQEHTALKKPKSARNPKHNVIAKKKFVGNDLPRKKKTKKATYSNVYHKQRNDDNSHRNDICDIKIGPIFHNAGKRTVKFEEDFPRNTTRTSKQSVNRDPWLDQDDSLFSMKSVRSSKHKEYLANSNECDEGRIDCQVFHSQGWDEHVSTSKRKRRQRGHRAGRNRKKRKTDLLP